MRSCGLAAAASCRRRRVLLPHVPGPQLLEAQLLCIPTAIIAAPDGLLQCSRIVRVHCLAGLAPAGLLLLLRRWDSSSWHLRLPTRHFWIRGHV